MKIAGTQQVGSPAQSPEVAFKYDQCEAVYDSKDNLEKHIDETHTEQLTCKECDYTSTSVKCMTEHEKLEHSIEQLDGSTEIIQKTQLIKCEHCEFKAETMQHLKTHVSFKHQGLKCNYCEFKNLSKDILEKHMDTNHKNQSKGEKAASPFTCTYCGEVLENKLKHHVHEVYCPKRA